jgi:hypothetical protein
MPHSYDSAGRVAEDPTFETVYIRLSCVRNGFDVAWKRTGWQYAYSGLIRFERGSFERDYCGKHSARGIHLTVMTPRLRLANSGCHPLNLSAQLPRRLVLTAACIVALPKRVNLPRRMISARGKSCTR